VWHEAIPYLKNGVHWFSTGVEPLYIFIVHLIVQKNNFYIILAVSSLLSEMICPILRMLTKQRGTSCPFSNLPPPPPSAPLQWVGKLAPSQLLHTLLSRPVDFALWLLTLPVSLPSQSPKGKVFVCEKKSWPSTGQTMPDRPH
jgi:hypothetical protein